MEWLPPRAPPGPGPAPARYEPPPAAAWQEPPAAAGNGDAVASFVCAVVGISLLVLSVGMSSVVSLALGIVALPYSRRGIRNVEERRTAKHGDLARAGRVIGTVTLVLASLATLFWLVMLLLALGGAFDEPYPYEWDGEVVLDAVPVLAAPLFPLPG